MEARTAVFKGNLAMLTHFFISRPRKYVETRVAHAP